MKITSFDPLILTSDLDSAAKLFEALGFEKKHAPASDINGTLVTGFRMKHPNGYHVDLISDPESKADYMQIRMNVDDFAEAYGILKAHGYTNTRGDDTLDLKSVKAATMVAPSGFRISLLKHIKDHD